METNPHLRRLIESPNPRFVHVRAALPPRRVMIVDKPGNIRVGPFVLAVAV